QNNMPNNTWGWVKWGEANLTAGNYELEVAYREGGTLMDQILVTSNTDTPTGIMTLVDPSALGDRRECSASTPSHYLEFARNPERYRIGESSGSDSLIESGRSLAFDGACLTRYQIGKTQADGEAFINGAGVTRTVLEEKQNFANWFQYYRRRHQAMRGGLAAAVQGINGIKTGMFWINNRRTVGSAQMKDVGVGTELGTFLDEHYTRVNAGGTPLRSALNHARNQFKSTTGPITSECQKNYTLLFTDGFNTQNTTSEVQSVLNDGIGNQDGSAGAPYQDSYSTTLG
ncbi:VWA domain-containing protein, partial [Oleiphilus sp. HI0067]